MLILFGFLFETLVFAQPCGPDRIHIREQQIKAYSKTDGSEVKGHRKNPHCRLHSFSNYFADTTKQKFRTISPKLVKWTDKEKALVQAYLAALPPWLNKYSLQEILRSDVGEHVKNPATSLPAPRTLIIYDQFFKEKNQRGVIIHELAHIALPTIDPNLLIEFSIASGWKVDRNFLPVPPEKLIKPDSSHSIEEDFANHIETYYTDPSGLMTVNPLSFVVIRKVIESAETANE